LIKISILEKVKPFILVIKEPFQYLILGLGIYVFFRSSQVYFNNWLLNQKIGFDLQWVRTYTLQLGTFLPDWFLFSLPDGLWLLSFCLLMKSLWGQDNKRMLWFWTLILPVVSLFWEIGQSIKIISGTFDFIDLLFYSIVTLIIIHKNTKTNYEKSH
jgi:hypothetical protein